ncbi:hypothetical protein SAY86_014116 [Trapa natans]|uniref:Uncharacterized protein n=1 Tax=Trapa natans TaxID=22666 RepID=A0AAN7L000_TRANT|nr:hypothetical protein SAY86_014116 [Trapa natans]
MQSFNGELNAEFSHECNKCPYGTTGRAYRISNCSRSYHTAEARDSSDSPRNFYINKERMNFLGMFLSELLGRASPADTSTSTNHVDINKSLHRKKVEARFTANPDAP